MQKIRFLFLILFLPGLLLAQQKSRVELISSSTLNVDAKKNISYVKNPVFRHDNATLSCDSAVFYSDLNYFEAFKNVHINQADTINIYSDLLNYDGNKKMAHLINNVRMIDPTSVLTTNILDYDMGLKIGTYINGGKIVNKEVTLTSKRGWYFANTNDAWFKLNVDVVTPQVNIKSDSLRYNTVSNWAYFYGPTNIKGKDDNLYTEDGAYNTKSENAYFGKKNLYTQGSRSLKGDSLYYYGKRGYGRAVKNIVFQDSEDKLLLRGQLGEYYKKDERVIVTKNAYVGLGTADSVELNHKKIPDSLWLGADTLEAQMVLQHTLTLIPTPVILKDNEIGAESEQDKKDREAAKANANGAKAPGNPATNKIPSPKVVEKKDKKASKKNGKDDKALPNVSLPTDSLPKPPKLLDLKPDSIGLDSLKKATGKADSLLALKKVDTKDAAKVLNKVAQKADTVKALATDAATKLALPKAAVKKPNAKDSLPFNPADTVRTRSIKAYHDVRVYKSNLQAKSDSLFYTAADSTLRWYQNPIIWSENSQQTGDTIYVQFKAKKVNSLQVIKNGFMVNTEGDSTKFNQVKGKLITGFFENGELKNMYVDGNAESIYFSKDSKGAYDRMNQTVSGRIKFSFVDKDLDNITTIKENEGAYYSINELPKETLLTGFIWKPELRPVSKADIIKGKAVAKKEVKPVAKPKTPAASNGKSTTAKKEVLPLKKPNEAAIKAVIAPAKALLDKVKLDSLKLDTPKLPPIKPIN